ncbi:MAG: type II secretion system protein [Candidatus Berkelbacteria bacterium]|nr:type II secretion system protein [Candidatus Berkelbacteria bacterium]
MIIYIKKRKKAFGLLEVLLAGVIIIIILGALVLLARNAINNSAYVQERAQATGLAQEGMEIVRQIRDTNQIDKNPTTNWKTMVGPNLTNSFRTDRTYYIAYDKDSSRFYLSETSTSDIIGGVSFIRKITFASVGTDLLTKPIDVSNGGSNGIIVKVNVNWPANQAHNVAIEEKMTNSRFVF